MKKNRSEFRTLSRLAPYDFCLSRKARKENLNASITRDYSGLRKNSLPIEREGGGGGDLRHYSLRGEPHIQEPEGKAGYGRIKKSDSERNN
jgi:hypothetical protein